jgi:predicted dehydrogenase
VSVIPYHNRRWDGDFLTVAELLASGRLGDIWRFESRFERWQPGAPAPGSWKSDPTLPGGGILFDLGSHLVDQVLQLFGRPSAVYAEMAAHAGPLDDDAFVALSYADGTAVHLWASSTAARLGPRFRILGSQRAYVKYGLDPQEAALRAGRLPSEPGWGEEPAEAWGEIGTVDGAEPVPTRPGAYQQFYAGVAEHLLGNAAPPVDVADAIAGLRVLEAAVASARSGDVMPIGGY